MIKYPVSSIKYHIEHRLPITDYRLLNTDSLLIRRQYHLNILVASDLQNIHKILD